MKKFINWLKSEESGQGMVEYGLIIALVSVTLIVVLGALSGGLGDVFNAAKDALGIAADETPTS